MSCHNIVRAWKDQEYRLGLSESERALLPEHPAGMVELTDAELEAAAGGVTYFCSVFCTQHPIGCGGQTNSHIWC
jgi:mersacidin/lichenicidin family type 2 lantibiotic